MQARAKAWLQLLRVPNLFTVPGDPLAGFLLAWAVMGWALTPLALVEALLLPALASLLLYASGLLENDLCDLAEDRRDRPGRPLPSGRVSAGAALTVCVLLRLAALATAWLVSLAAVCLAGGIILASAAYNRYLKRVPVVGPINMGLCRGLSVLVGAAVFREEGLKTLTSLAAAVVVTGYIAAVTAIAAGETAGRTGGQRRNLPASILAFAFTLTFLVFFRSESLGWETVAFIALASAATIWAGWCGIRLSHDARPASVSRTVGSLIRGLLLVQAAFCCLLPSPGLAVAAVLLAFWPASWLLGRRFYAS